MAWHAVVPAGPVTETRTVPTPRRRGLAIAIIALVIVLSLGAGSLSTDQLPLAALFWGVALVLATVVVAVYRLSPMELCVITMPITFYASLGVILNVSLADVVLLWAVIMLVFRFARRTEPIRVHRQALGFLVLLVLVLLGSLLVSAVQGTLSSGLVGAVAIAKLVLVGGYLLWFAGSRPDAARVRRLLFCWLSTAVGVVAAGSLGIGLYSVDIDLGLSYFFRLTGPFEDPNAAGTYLLLSIGIGFAYWLAYRRPWALLPVVILVVGIVLTGSRGLLIALAGAVVLAPLLTFTRPSARRLLGQLLMLSPALLVVGVIALPLAPPGFFDSLIARLSGGGGALTDDPRFVYWDHAIQLWNTYPITGIGIGQFPRSIQPVAGEDVSNVVHNTFLGFLTETGIIGFAVAVGGWLALAWVARRIRIEGVDVGAAWAFSVVGVTICTFSLNLENFRPLWAMAGLILMLASLTPQSRSRTLTGELRGGTQ